MTGVYCWAKPCRFVLKFDLFLLKQGQFEDISQHIVLCKWWWIMSSFGSSLKASMEELHWYWLLPLSLPCGNDFMQLLIPSCSRSKEYDGSRVPDVSRDIPLDVKLRELDALYAPKLAAAEGSRDKNDRYVEARKWGNPLSSNGPLIYMCSDSIYNKQPNRVEQNPNRHWLEYQIHLILSLELSIVYMTQVQAVLCHASYYIANQLARQVCIWRCRVLPQQEEFLEGFPDM